MNSVQTTVLADHSVFQRGLCFQAPDRRSQDGCNRRRRYKSPRSTRCPVNRCCFPRSEEHTSELQSLMRISYAVFCLKKKKKQQKKKRKQTQATKARQITNIL